MRLKPLVKPLLVAAGATAAYALGLDAFAANAVPSSGLAAVAYQAKSQLGSIAQLITAGSYVAGMGFGVASIVKFKAHKDQPTQVPVGQPIVLLFIAAALLFIPSVYTSTGQSLFASGQQAGISGVNSFNN